MTFWGGGGCVVASLCPPPFDGPGRLRDPRRRSKPLSAWSPRGPQAVTSGSIMPTEQLTFDLKEIRHTPLPAREVTGQSPTWSPPSRRGSPSLKLSLPRPKSARVVTGRLRGRPAPTTLNRRDDLNAIGRMDHRHGVVCLTLAKWETVSGQFGGYLIKRFYHQIKTDYVFRYTQGARIDPRPLIHDYCATIRHDA